MRVDFDHGPLPGGTSFVAPHRLIRADTPATVSAAFAAMEDAIARGFWLAGYASYELGYALSTTLAPLLPAARRMPLLHFGVFDAPQAAQANDHGHATLTAPMPMWDQSRYNTAFAHIAEFIAAGDIYQANLTFPLQTRYTGTPAALYANLRAHQPAPYGAYVDLGGPVLLSRSPELFFSIDVNGVISAQPMKGTAARGATAQADAAQIAWLQTSEKNQAENLMIVDLMRNDIGRLAEIGSVRVPDLFTVETYATLHQMTSRITAQLRPNLTVQEIFTALFPCGSITGAPKIRAMEIIHMLEDTPRNAYCGAIGWIGPDRSMRFNVAIRTLTCHPDGSAKMNVGGGIVYDSDPAEEYAEALLKARFAQIGTV
ncbi:MAG: aminodeoxychorismate synthase component I [Alphaproteobacteria bacterium]|nr:aminodeoxychorismate synthase component I [Alphaproteobacteria bacterium]